jgi:hypothetical protein
MRRLGAHRSRVAKVCAAVALVLVAAILAVKAAPSILCAFFGPCLSSIRPVKMAAANVPGTYVYEGEGFRDELTLRADRTFSRRALYRGDRQTQRGRWDLSDPQEALASVVTFDLLVPPYLHLTTTTGTMATPHVVGPNEIICAPESMPECSDGLYSCEAEGRQALCVDELAYAAFLKQ